MYKYLIKPLLFSLQPEQAHHVTLAGLRWGLAMPGARAWLAQQLTVSHPALRRRVMGLDFPNPVGLAAGFDKDGKHFEDMAAMGFGFVEIGTVTPRPQAGNPLPRLFRLPADEAVINRMGFNNGGVALLAQRLEARRAAKGIIIGGNIGKNKDTPNEQAAADYTACFKALFSYVDYFVVNVSSPNTPNLRDLQDKEPLTALLVELQVLNEARDSPKPILLKIAPDLTEGQLDDIVDIVQQTGIAGLIATNTTVARTGLHTPPDAVAAMGAGGLSGQPVKARSTWVIRYLRAKLGSGPVIIGVGGIASAADALEKLEAGADLLQVYTGLVYEGPTLVRDINRGLLAAFKEK